jgi:hypothetical protein
MITGGPVSYPKPKLDFENALTQVLRELNLFLREKNKKYGNSALRPIRVFSKADSREQLLVRMDDKLSRIRTAAPGDEEDAIQDLLGYLILMRTGELMDA